MSKPVSWRPSPAAAVALADLMQRTGKKRAQLLDDLILAADRAPDIVANNDRPSAPVARERLRVDHEKIAAFQRKAGMTVYDKRRNRG